MAGKLEIYKCSKCGIVVEVVGDGGGVMTCCDVPMALLEEKTADATTEKHVPVIEHTEKGITVKVGSVPHPMTEEHWIQWIELIVDGRACRKFLNPGDKPETCFAKACIGKNSTITVREMCNLHGLWKA